MAYSCLRIAVIRIGLTVPLCTLSCTKVISGAGAVCQPVGTPLYLFGVKCTCVSRIPGRGAACTGRAGAVPARCLRMARRIWHRLHLLADVQRRQSRLQPQK